MALQILAWHEYEDFSNLPSSNLQNTIKVMGREDKRPKQIHPGDFLLTQSWSYLVTSFLPCDIGGQEGQILH